MPKAKKKTRKEEASVSDSSKPQNLIKAQFIEKKIRKAEKDIIQFNSKLIEDDFIGFESSGVIFPPFEPKWLKLLCSHNNTLAQAIAAMEVNIDGSGFIIEEIEEEDKGRIPSSDRGVPIPDEQGNKTPTGADALPSLEQNQTQRKVLKKDSSDVIKLKDFFAQVNPKESFLTVRRKLRVDMESTGNGYLEVLRNAKGDIMALKHVDSTTIRLIRLGGPVLVSKKMIRGGKEIEIQMWVRERVFMQRVANTSIFFAEFGASRSLHKTTGKWATLATGNQEAVTIEFTDRATEIIHFKINDDANGPYGVPRWINQMPSILGSRKAEEENLTFFDSGGVPPVIITLMGGNMVSDVKKQLNNFLAGKGTNTRVAVLEVASSDSNIDKSGTGMKIDVQRFGAEKTNDCHDDKTEVLTSQGWLLFKDLEDNQEIATLNPVTGELEYHAPDKHIKQYYKGPMFEAKTQATNFCVTGNHDLRLRTEVGQYFKLKAEKWNRGKRYVTTSAIENSPCLKKISIPRYRKQIHLPDGFIHFEPNMFLRFLGLYLGDGYTKSGRVDYGIEFGAKSKFKICEFEKSLNALTTYLPKSKLHRYDLKTGATVFYLPSKSLATWLRETIGHGAKNKKLPDWALRLNKPQSDILLQGLLDTDGSKKKGSNTWTYWSASEQLADGVQILALRCGSRAIITCERGKYWRVNIIPNKSETIIAKFPTKINYEGMIYCVEVQNHLVLTRREGKTIISGNSMFENYDEKCSERVRSSFRLPPLFLGKLKDLNFATALTSYLIAESQVFQPERKEFDEIINSQIIPALGIKNARMRSMPIAIKDIKTQLDALKFACQKGWIGREQGTEVVNEITGLDLAPDDIDDEKAFPETEEVQGLQSQPGGNAPSQGNRTKPVGNGKATLPQVSGQSGNLPGQPSNAQRDRQKSSHTPEDRKKPKMVEELLALAERLVTIIGGRGDGVDLSDEEKKKVFDEIDSLDNIDRDNLNALIASKTFDGIYIDQEGSVQLMGCALDILETTIKGDKCEVH